MTSRTGNSGFTLIEVLVASVILFAGLGAILRAYSSAVTALDTSADIMATSLLFSDRVAELELQAADDRGAMSSTSGTAMYNGVAYKWQARVRLQFGAPGVEIQSALISATRARGGLLRAVDCEWPIFKDLETRPSNIQP